MSNHVRVEDAASVALSGFQPSSAPRLPCASTIVEVGRVFRGAIVQLDFDAEGKLLLLCGGRVERLDPNTLETTSTWLDGGWLEGFQVLANGALLLHAREADESTLARCRFGEVPKVFFRGDAFGGFAATADGATIVIPTAAGVRVLEPSGAVRAELTMPPDAFGGGVQDGANGLVDIAPCGRHVARWQRMRDGRMWVDGVLRQHVVRGTRNGAPFEEEQPTSYQSPAFVSADRFVHQGVDAWTLCDLESGEALGRAARDGSVAIGGGRVVVTDGLGGYTEHDPRTFKPLAERQGLPRHYGTGSTHRRTGAVSASHVASYAPTYGVLFVTSAAGTSTRGDHFEQLDQLTVSAKGDRLVVQSGCRERAFAIDLHARTRRDVVSPEGLQGPAVSDDGAHVILACGTNLRARTVYVAPFDGGEPAEAHASMTWSRGTRGFSGRRYLHAASNDKSGWLGVFELGKGKAIAKVKRKAWRFAVSRDGNTAAVVESKGAGQRELAIVDLANKAKEIEVIAGDDVALGSGRDTLAFIASGDHGVRLHLRSKGSACDVAIEKDHGRIFAFSEDDTALFVAERGSLKVFDAQTGALAATLATGAIPVSIVVNGGLLWLLGEDGVLRAYGCPQDQHRR